MTPTQKELLRDLISEYAEACMLLEREYMQGTDNSIKAAIGTKFLKSSQLGNLIEAL